MPRKQVIYGRKYFKNQKIKLTVAYKEILFRTPSNKTPPSPPYCVNSKRKAIPEGKSNEELPAPNGDDYSYSPLVIDDDLNMVDMSAGNFTLNNHTHSQQYYDPNNDVVSNGYSF